MSDTVKRRDALGTVWERVQKKQPVQPGQFHWCNTDAPEWVDSETPPHVCDIWQRAEDQNWKPPEPAADSGNPIDSLINKLKTTTGDIESIPVLAMLYQAKALERIADYLCEMKHFSFLDEFKTAMAIQNLGGSTPLQTQSAASGGTVCRMCQLDEHARCLNPLPISISQADGHHVVGRCRCITCNTAPTNSSYSVNPLAPKHQHPFEGMEDNHFCTQCGGGRLHPIHQV